MPWPDEIESMWDVFISHASEDKEAIARPIADALSKAGFRVWYDDFTLRLGDGLSRSINRGLAESKYGIVILSPNFFAKEWPQRELDGLTAREVSSGKIILPVWHNVTQLEVANYSPILADKLGVSTDKGLDVVVHEILEVLREESGPREPSPRPRIKGRWKADVIYDWGAKYTESFAFTLYGDEVHGTASLFAVDRGIFDGKLSGNKLTFITKTREVLGESERIVTRHYTGMVSGNEIRFIMQTEGGYSEHVPVEFTAKRMPNTKD